jgi:hypothetical protein
MHKVCRTVAVRNKIGEKQLKPGEHLGDFLLKAE